MTAEPGSVQEAAERNAEAIVSGNFAQVMADLTPEAMGQLMGLGSSGGMSMASLPTVTGYELSDKGAEGDAHVFEVTFLSPSGKATLAATWKRVMEQWKITAIAVVAAEAG